MRTILTAVVGILPATALFVFAAASLFGAIYSLATNEGTAWYWLLVAVMSLFGVVGYLALWRALLRPVDKATAAGLAIGIPANCFAIVMLARANPHVLAHWFWMMGPIVVAVAYLAVFSVGHIAHRHIGHNQG